jgi:PST family polysaccharide transporter
VDNIVTGTLYPALCAVADRTDLLAESFVKSNRLALMWAMPFGFGLTLFAPDIVHFLIGEEWRPATVLLQAFGATAAIGHLGFNWDAYFRARGDTRPMAIVTVASMVTFLAVGLPLLWAHGLDGLAAGIAAQMLVAVAGRAYFLRRLFSGLDVLRHAARAMAPTVPAVLAVLALRLAEPRHRGAGVAVAELAVYVVVTIALTWRFEAPLLREAAAYVRRRGASPA